jgi:hypothetical protein
LLKRVFAVDVLECPRYQGPMRVLSFIDDARIARRILEHLGLPARAPPRSRRRGPQLLPLAVASAEFDGVDPLLQLD